MVTLPLVGVGTQTRGDTAVVRGEARPATVLAGLPGDTVDRRGGPNPRLAQGADTRGPTPDAPSTQRAPHAATRIAAAIGSYSVGSIIGTGVAVALGASLGPILILGVVAGFAAALGTDNLLTIGRVFP